MSCTNNLISDNERVLSHQQKYLGPQLSVRLLHLHDPVKQLHGDELQWDAAGNACIIHQTLRSVQQRQVWWLI